MEIYFEQSRGFAGIDSNILIDNNPLQPKEAAELQRCSDRQYLK